MLLCTSYSLKAGRVSAISLWLVALDWLLLIFTAIVMSAISVTPRLWGIYEEHIRCRYIRGRYNNGNIGAEKPIVCLNPPLCHCLFVL